MTALRVELGGHVRVKRDEKFEHNPDQEETKRMEGIIAGPLMSCILLSTRGTGNRTFHPVE
jgi:hypothetical protein